MRDAPATPGEIAGELRRVENRIEAVSPPGDWNFERPGIDLFPVATAQLFRNRLPKSGRALE